MKAAGFTPAACSSSKARPTPARSPGSTTRTHGASDPSPPSDGEIAAISVVTPWYALLVTTTPVPPVACLAMRRARSFASLPVQANIMVSMSAGSVSSICSA